MFRNLIFPRNTQINAPFANKCRDIGGRQEDESEGVVFYEGDVETGFATELDVDAFEEGEGWGLETAFCGEGLAVGGWVGV